MSILGSAIAGIIAVACGASSGTATTAAPLPTSTVGGGAAAATQAPAVPGPGAIVEPDGQFQAKLDNAGIRTAGWTTDFSRHTVAFDEILSGGVPRDGIPPLDDPKFTSIDDADLWLEDLQPVISFKVNDEARAYPIAVLTWHEVVNDIVGGVPVTVTFCPLCNSAMVFDRTLEGRVFDFGVSGNLRNSDLIMWDRQTQTWWQQLTGEGIVGELAGHQLEFLPASIISWGDYKLANPDTLVLSRETGFNRPYGRNPYSGYDRADQPAFLFDGRPDERLLPKERVAAFNIGEVSAAFPFLVLEEERVVNYNVNNTDVVVFFKPGTVSALDQGLIIDSRDIGSSGVFEAELDGRKLTFRAEGDEAFVDNETGTTWNILGEAIAGQLAGQSLTPIVHGDHFWFAWGAFNPDTKIYSGQG